MAHRLCRRAFLTLVPALVRAAEAGPDTARGRLTVAQGAKPASLVTADGRRIELRGDPATAAVLADRRLAGMDLEVIGRFESATTLTVGPSHLRAMFVHRGGKRLLISYWCEVCSIRTYTPGQCMCCQDETALDLKERFDP